MRSPVAGRPRGALLHGTAWPVGTRHDPTSARAAGWPTPGAESGSQLRCIGGDKGAGRGGGAGVAERRTHLNTAELPQSLLLAAAGCLTRDSTSTGTRDEGFRERWHGDRAAPHPPAGGVGKNGCTESECVCSNLRQRSSTQASRQAGNKQASKPGVGWLAGWLAGWPVKHSPVSYLGRVGRANVQRATACSAGTHLFSEREPYVSTYVLSSLRASAGPSWPYIFSSLFFFFFISFFAPLSSGV